MVKSPYYPHEIRLNPMKSPTHVVILQPSPVTPGAMADFGRLLMTAMVPRAVRCDPPPEVESRRTISGLGGQMWSATPKSRTRIQSEKNGKSLEITRSDIFFWVAILWWSMNQIDPLWWFWMSIVRTNSLLLEARPVPSSQASAQRLPEMEELWPGPEQSRWEQIFVAPVAMKMGMLSWCSSVFAVKMASPMIRPSGWNRQSVTYLCRHAWKWLSFLCLVAGRWRHQPRNRGCNKSWVPPSSTSFWSASSISIGDFPAVPKGGGPRGHGATARQAWPSAAPLLHAAELEKKRQCRDFVTTQSTMGVAWGYQTWLQNPLSNLITGGYLKNGAAYLKLHLFHISIIS